MTTSISSTIPVDLEQLLLAEGSIVSETILAFNDIVGILHRHSARLKLDACDFAAMGKKLEYAYSESRFISNYDVLNPNIGSDCEQSDVYLAVHEGLNDASILMTEHVLFNINLVLSFTGNDGRVVEISH